MYLLGHNFLESDFKVDLASTLRIKEMLPGNIKRKEGSYMARRRMRIIQLQSCKGPPGHQGPEPSW